MPPSKRRNKSMKKRGGADPIESIMNRLFTLISGLFLFIGSVISHLIFGTKNTPSDPASTVKTNNILNNANGLETTVEYDEENIYATNTPRSRTYSNGMIETDGEGWSGFL